jgi:hypothetical protein
MANPRTRKSDSDFVSRRHAIKTLGRRVLWYEKRGQLTAKKVRIRLSLSTFYSVGELRKVFGDGAG